MKGSSFWDYIPAWSTGAYSAYKALKELGDLDYAVQDTDLEKQIVQDIENSMSDKSTSSNWSFNTTVPLNFSYHPASVMQLQGSSYTGPVLRKIVYGNKRKVKNAKYPLVDRIEMNGTASATHVLYISMGPNFERTVTNVIKTMIYALLNNSGFEYSNFDHPMDRNMRITTSYHDDYQTVSPTVTKTFSSDCITTDSINDWAATYLAGLRSAAGGSNVAFDIQDLTLYESSNSFATVIGTLDPKKLMIKGIMNYALLFQNQSLGGSASSSSADDVTNNPLHVTHYQILGNHYREKQRSEGFADARPTTYKPFVHWGSADYKDLIVRDAGAQWTTPQYQAGKIFTNTGRANTFVMNPGQMKKTSMTIVEAHSYYAWVSLFYPYFLSASPILRPIKFGGSRMLMFDKMINSGENVTVSYELNLKHTWGYKIFKAAQVMPMFKSESIAEPV